MAIWEMWVYISEIESHYLVDICAYGFKENATVIFVRVSDHPSVSFENTYYGDYNGPFKVLEPQNLIQL